MDDVRKRWDAYWSRRAAAEHDGAWLGPYLGELLSVSGPLVELGSGAGDDTATLLDTGRPVVVVDYSRAALSVLGSRVPGALRILADMRGGLPLVDGCAAGVVASLCLHYFDAATTTAILADVARCLRPGGALLARVNATRDVHYGAEGHPAREHHFYDVDGRPKRFFDRADIERFFGAAFTLARVQECAVGIEPEKHTWLVLGRR